MYYSIRPAGSRTKKQQVEYLISVVGFILRLAVYLGFSLFALVAVFTGNVGAVAILFLLFIVLGLGFNLFKLRSWLPGWKRGSAFKRIICLTLYVFSLVLVLMVSNP